MSTDTFVLYSIAHISHEEYIGWLQELNAVMTSEEAGGAYDARISKDICHVWVSLLDEEWFAMDMAEFADEPEVLANICQLLGGAPKSAIVLDANTVKGSQILAVQFTALCAEHYPCVVLQAAGQAIFSAQDLLKYRDAGIGFDGSTWATAYTRPSSPALTSFIDDEDEEGEYDEDEENEDALQFEEVYDYRVNPPTEDDGG